MNDQWEQFLDDVVSHIRDKKIKDETREELLDHLEDRKERFMRFGDSEEEAERKSLELMGDCDTISNQLGKLHSFSYIDQLSRAMLITFFGFLFSLFNINIGSVSILNPIGASLIFAGTYMLRGCNAKLKKAYRITLLKIVWTAFAYSSKAIPFFEEPPSEWITYSVIIVGMTISTIHYAYLLLGIGELSENAADGTNFVAPNMKRCIAAYILPNVILLLGTITENNSLVIPILIISFLCFAYIVISVWRAYTIIKRTQYRTESVAKFNKNGALILVGAIVLVASSALATCLIASMPKIKSEVYNQVHTEQADKIREELIEKGFPKDVVKFLPDEEIEKCYPLDETSVIHRSDEPGVYGDFLHIIGVPIIDRGTGERAMRYIYTFDYGYSSQKHGHIKYGYRDSVIVCNPFFAYSGSDSYGIFYEKDNVIYKQEPIKLHYNLINMVNGLEYRTLKDASRIYGYMAFTGDPIQRCKRSEMMVYISEKYPFNYTHYNVFDFVDDEAGALHYNPPPLSRVSLNWFDNVILSFGDFAVKPEDWQRELLTDEWDQLESEENVFGNYPFQH